ncbi:MAG: Grx4 family monothiol glutaredoxin [Gammaproteobacteria bacterium]
MDTTTSNTGNEQDEKVQQALKQQINQYPLLLFMKGRPEQPQCGFSARAVSLLSQCGKPFAWVDILAEPQIRRNLPQVSEWPTFPQLFIQGELIGGSDIIQEMFDAGELKALIDAVPAE